MAGSGRRKEHTRTRTGCYTCRKRRIKCDEQKPICKRCKKASRECSYPQPTTTKADTTGKDELRLPSGESGSSLDLEEAEDTEKTIVQFSSSSRDCPEYFSNLIDVESLIGGVPSIDSFSSIFDIPFDINSPMAIGTIPRAPTSNQVRSIQFFLKFHQDTITAAHYFRYFDLPKLHTKWLPAMAEQCKCLRYALVAFSALIYSIKVNPSGRQIAFYYYAMSLQGLRSILDTDIEYNSLIATALQLSAIDRFFGDAIKCLRHLQGVVRILEKYSNPTQQCSSVVGRSLFEWFCNYEDYCCALLAKKPLLPPIWRNENVRIRHEVARPPSSDADLLDNLWPRLWATIPALADILSEIPKIKGTRDLAARSRLLAQLEDFKSEVLQFTQSSDVLQIMQPEISFTLKSAHVTCCPPLPFVPYVLQFPPAGYLRLYLLGLKNYLNVLIEPALRPESAKKDDTLAYEMCRTFAGIENEFEPDALLPCFSALVLAGMLCPVHVRMWFWYKLAHFEKLGQFTLEPTKKFLSVLWEMPNLATEGFTPWKVGPPLHDIKVVSAHDIDIATKMANVSLDE